RLSVPCGSTEPRPSSVPTRCRARPGREAAEKQIASPFPPTREVPMRLTPSRLELFCIALLVLPASRAQTAELPDLGRIHRRIAKEPAYQSKQPLYGLYVFGPEARTRVWAVLDRSRPDASGYDVLYFDRNADGDLTGSGERIEGKKAGDLVTFDIGTFTDP